MGVLTRQHLPPLSRAPMTNQSSVPTKFTLGTNELIALTYRSTEDPTNAATWQGLCAAWMVASEWLQMAT